MMVITKQTGKTISKPQKNLNTRERVLFEMFSIISQYLNYIFACAYLKICKQLHISTERAFKENIKLSCIYPHT